LAGAASCHRLPVPQYYHTTMCWPPRRCTVTHNDCTHHELPYPEVTCRLSADLSCKRIQTSPGRGQEMVRNGRNILSTPEYRFTPTPNASYTSVIRPCYTPVIQTSLYAMACITHCITCYTAVIPAGFRMLASESDLPQCLYAFSLEVLGSTVT